MILLPFMVFLADIGSYASWYIPMNARPLIESDIAGTGIAAVQGLSRMTNADSVFIVREERITKSFLSSTVVVNGLCTCPYLSLGFACTSLLTANNTIVVLQCSSRIGSGRSKALCATRARPLVSRGK